MGSKEIIQLHELKEKLIKKVIYLKNRLKNREENECQKSINFNA